MRLSRIVFTLAMIGMLAACISSADLRLPLRRPGAEPVPIPGGTTFFPGAPLLHVFASGPPALGLQGLNVEPNVITDFKGTSALAYLAGSATDSAGNPYDLQCDIR